MSWQNDFEPLVTYALRLLDLRYSYFFARTSATITKTPGLYRALEPAVGLAVFEAFLGQGYVKGKSIDLERAYPSSPNVNPQRVDLAFKDGTVGSKWSFVELKYWSSNTQAIDCDIDKLVAETKKISRWLFLYRVRPKKNASLENLITKRLYTSSIIIDQSFKIETISPAPSTNKSGKKITLMIDGYCDVVLCQIK